MFARVACTAIAMMSAGCARDTQSLFPETTAAHLGGPVETVEQTGPVAAAPELRASKVLAAIAFQRVTGRDVDPARLVD